MLNKDLIEKYQHWAETQKEIFKKLTEIPNDDGLIEFYHKFQLTGTMASVLLNHSKWQTSDQLYNSFYEPVEACILRLKANKANVSLFLGKELEASVANYANQFLMPISEGVTITDFNRPWSCCQVDRTSNGVPFEIKTVNFNRKTKDGTREWGDGCIFSDYGKIIKEDSQVPIYYYDQVQKQIDLTGSDFAYICAYFKGEGVKLFKVYKDKDVIKAIRKAEDDFMFNNLIPQVAPGYIEPLEVDDTAEDANVAIANDEFLDLFKKLKDIRQMKNDLAKEDKILSDKIKAYMGDCTLAIDKQGLPLTKLAFSTRKSFDTTRFKKEQKEMYNQYIKETQTSVLTLCEEE